MTIEIKAPHYPESVEDGSLMKWHVEEGASVKAGQKLADIETDKIIMEVLAPEAGVVEKLAKQEGDTVLDAEVVALLGDGNGKAAAPAAAEPEPTPKTAAPAKEKIVMSPAVRALVTANELDPSSITGTGKGGRITKEDVLLYLKENAPEEEPAEKPAAAPSPGRAAQTSTADGRPEERVPMSRLRARIAERLLEVAQQTAMLTTFNEVNLHEIMAVRGRYKERFQKEHGVKLGLMSFFVKAAVDALKRFPVINASMDGNDVIYHGFFDIGIAVSTERGLVVPILRNADQLAFSEIESSIGEYAERAKEGKLTMEDLVGGTFTITNGGVFGSLLSTPILNPPQSAILGMHTIQQRPVAEDGKVVIRPMMYLALSYDHRIIDGRDAVQFLVAMKEILEDPARLLLQV